MADTHIVVIGAGIGGLTAAALLVQAGLRVTVLEAHIYPGGSAGTFYNRGYRFDAGATLAGGFSAGGPHARLAERLGLCWPVHPVDPAWVTHLPDRQVTQWADRTQWQAERERVFPGMEAFWKQQERLADVAWDTASRFFPWPPASLSEAVAAAAALRPRTLTAAPYLLRTVADLIPHRRLGRDNGQAFRVFLDAQLLISAQTTAQAAGALYGSAALDLPRRGVNHVQNGIGGLAQTLVRWIREHGGVVYYRQQAVQLKLRRGRVAAVQTSRGLHLACDGVIANLTPWGLAHLLGDDAPGRLRREVHNRPPTWGAFVLYLGLDSRRLPSLVTDHHQVVVNPALPLGEGNSVFISLSDASDASRAPAGMRAATLSTHTRIAPWWDLAQRDLSAYAARRADYTERVLTAAEQALPGLRAAVQLTLAGTPVTFQRFLRRPLGMVGGFPQTSLFHARGPGTGIANLWLAGDSVFPGQSTAGVTLSGWRVAEAVLRFAR